MPPVHSGDQPLTKLRPTTPYPTTPITVARTGIFLEDLFFLQEHEAGGIKTIVKQGMDSVSDLDLESDSGFSVGFRFRVRFRIQFRLPIQIQSRILDSVSDLDS